MRWFTMFLATASALSAMGSSAVADPITFTFSGTLSGTLGGEDFEDASAEFTLTTDTNGIVSAGPNTLVTPNTSLNFIIDGEDGTFNSPFHVFRAAFGTFAPIGLSPESGDDLLDITNASLATYDLRTPFGPLTQAPPDFVNPGEAYATSAGDLVLRISGNESLTFEATVPEPTALMLAVPAGLLLLRRRR